VQVYEIQELEEPHSRLRFNVKFVGTLGRGSRETSN